MESYFEEFFEKHGGMSEPNSGGWNTVLCPFPHKRNDGTSELESHPSAHVNLETGYFDCKACGTQLTETQFIQRLNPGLSEQGAVILTTKLRPGDDETALYQEYLKHSPKALEFIRSLGWEPVAKELQLGFDNQNSIVIPVFVNDIFLGNRFYAIEKREGQPKIKGSKGLQNSIFPYDAWLKDDRSTLLCAGEKDCLISRAMGFNAITFTGGEGSFPKLEIWRKSLQGKKIYIVYDNDQTGREGAERTAVALKNVGAIPYIVKGHWKIAKEEKEDIWDYFIKYKQTKADLEAILHATEPFQDTEYKQFNKKYRIRDEVSLLRSTKPSNVRKQVQTRISVVSTYDAAYQVPTAAIVKKIDKETGEELGQYFWYYDTENPKYADELLYLVETKTKDLNTYFRSVAERQLGGVTKKDSVIWIEKASATVHKAIVADDQETEYNLSFKEDEVFELAMYVLDQRLEDGKRYNLVYTPVPHPIENRKVVGVVAEVNSSDDVVSTFKMTPEIKESLKCFQGDVYEKMDELYGRAKSFTSPELQKNIFYATELFFHTPLHFKFGNRLERGYLDVMIAGESRTGKSKTAEQLVTKYKLGTIVSLKTATLQGIIGGSNKDSNGTYRTRLGLLPRSHKGAVIFEEFSGAGSQMISQMTDVRSSDRVRITRVDGWKTAPAVVRKLTLSNQATKDGVTIPLRRYANGVQVLLDLIGAAEDIARYDFCMLVDKPEKYIAPTTKVKEEAYDDESYLNRIRWIWSRQPEQIIIEPPQQELIVTLSQSLNERFDSHINFLGSEAWKKLTRIAIAVAATTASMDESGENVIVRDQHIEWAHDFLTLNYDNDIFRLPQFVEEEKRYRREDDAAVKLIEDLHNKCPNLLQQLDQGTSFTMSHLAAMSGLGDDFSPTISRLFRAYMLQMHGSQVVPSERFRLAYRKAGKTRLPRVGEIR